MCICCELASVSISAGCEGVHIVRICVYAKCLNVYIPVCSCINWVTSAKLCECVCVCVRACVCACECVCARCIVLCADV